MEAAGGDAAPRSKAAAEAKVNELERERMVTERAVAVEQARVDELNARLAAVNAGLNAEAKKLRDFGPERSVVRNMGANEVHRQLRRERLNRIKFLVDRRQRLLLIHDKTATTIERIRRSITNKRLTQVQTRGSFERKQTELEVQRHKLVLCLEAANAADEERKEATQRRMAALEEEEVAVAAYEKEKASLDEDTGRLLRALAGRKTAQERRAEAEGSQHFVGELPIDMEREIKAEIQQSERMAELEREKIKQAQQEIDKVEATLQELCDRIGVSSWEQAVEWWLGRAEAQLALTRRINMVDEEIASMEERLTEAERGKRRFLRTQRRTLSVRHKELNARNQAARLVAEEAQRVQERVEEASKMTEAIGSAVEGAFYAVECNRLPVFREALATIYMSNRQRGHAGGGRRAPPRAAGAAGGAAAEETAVALRGGGAGVSRLAQRRTSLFRPGRLQQSEEQRLESLLSRFADQIDASVVADADEAEALALAAESAKLETEGEAEARRVAALASAGVGGDFVEDEDADEGGRRAGDAAGSEGGSEAKNADDAGSNQRPNRRRRKHTALERLHGRRKDAPPSGVHQMVEMLRTGCTSETMLLYLEAVESTTATLVAELARLRPETVDSRPPSALVSEVELVASDDGERGASDSAAASGHLDSADDQGPAFVRMGKAWGTPLTLRVKPPSVKRGKARSRAEREAEALKELASHARRGSDLPDSAILRVLRAAKREAEGAGSGLAGSSSESSDEDDDAISLESGAAPAPQGIVFQRASVAPIDVESSALPRSAGQRRGSISLVPETPGTAGSAVPGSFGTFGSGLRISSPPSPALAPTGSRARTHTPDSSAYGQAQASPLPTRGAVRRLASGRLGAAGSLTPLGGVAPPPSAGSGTEVAASWAPPSPGSTAGREGAGTPSDTPSGVAARLLASGSKYTGAPRKAMSPLDAKGGVGAMQRASRVIVDRAGSSRDLAESLRLRSMSEAGTGAPEPPRAGFGGPVGGMERGRSASEAGEMAGGRVPFGTGIDEDAVGSDSEGSARNMAPPQGELRIVAKPTLHLHKQFRHLPEDPDMPSPVVGQTPTGAGEFSIGEDESAVFSPERAGHRTTASGGSAALGSARADPAAAPEGGRWERRGTFAERGDISRAGGRGDDETSVNELAGAISAELRRSHEEQRPAVRIVRPGIDRTTGTTTAKPSTRGFGGNGPRRSSGTTSRHRSAARDSAAKAEAKEVEPPARGSAAGPAARRGEEDAAARSHSPMRSSKGKTRKRKTAKRARSRKGKASASDAVAATFAADAAGAKADVDDLLGRAGARHRSAIGAFMRDVDGGGADRPRRRAVDSTGGGQRLSHAGGRDARAFAVSTAGLGTSKASAMLQGGESGADQGIAALGSVAATLSSQLVEQDIARMAQAARARRSQQHRADARLLAESPDAGFGASMASTVATSLGRPSRA